MDLVRLIEDLLSNQPFQKRKASPCNKSIKSGIMVGIYSIVEVYESFWKSYANLIV